MSAAGRARALAERCFALARSTTFQGEREAAVSRGTAIAQAAGLDLDSFDIPGRVRSGGPSMRFRSERAPERYSREELREAMQRFRAGMQQAERSAGAQPGESAYDARRRNFDQAAAAARARDARRAELRRRWPTGTDAANHLFARGVSVYPAAGGRWYLADRDDELCPDELREVAAEIAA